MGLVSVAQSFDHDGVSLTVPSVELYDRGFLMPTWLRTVAADSAFPEVIFQVEDDRGGVYRCWPIGVAFGIGIGLALGLAFDAAGQDTPGR